MCGGGDMVETGRRMFICIKCQYISHRLQAALAGSGARVRVLEGDWFKPPSADDDGDTLVVRHDGFFSLCVFFCFLASS